MFESSPTQENDSWKDPSESGISPEMRQEFNFDVGIVFSDLERMIALFNAQYPDAATEAMLKTQAEALKTLGEIKSGRDLPSSKLDMERELMDREEAGKLSASAHELISAII